jgi:DNA-binding beta-propeller fold protein YncE
MTSKPHAARNIDCRGKPVPAVGRELIEHYNAASPGDCFMARLDAYPPGLRIWLLEAGARHHAEAALDDKGGWWLTIHRGASPAQGSIPGVHHVLGAGGMIWAAQRASRVVRIDAGTGDIAACADVAVKASHLALDAEARTLFIADAGDDRVIAVRAADLAFEQAWAAPGMPQLPVATPDGIVCVTGGASGTLTIARPFDGRYAEQTISVGHSPHDPLLSQDASHVFVSCAGDSQIVKVRLSDGRIVGRCTAGGGPTHLALSADGTRVYSANSWDGTLHCMTVDGEHLGSAASGGWAHAIETTPDGRWIYVANFLDDTLAVFDSHTLQRAALLQTEPYPHGLDISPDGRYAIATGFSSDHLRIYDAQTHTEIARVEVGRGSSHTAFLDDANTAFVGCSVSDHVARVDLAGCCNVERIQVLACG